MRTSMLRLLPILRCRYLSSSKGLGQRAGEVVVIDYLDPAVLVASSAAGRGKAALEDHAIWKHKPVVTYHPASGRSTVVLNQDMALKLQV